MQDVPTDFLQQMQLIQRFSLEDDASFNRMLFQEMVLEGLSVNEKASYIDLLIESGRKNEVLFRKALA
jgi:hypothetical protein